MWADPFSILGWLSIPFFVSNLAVAIGFFMTVFFGWQYTKQFYEGRDKPLSWGLIIAGLSFLAISEFGQFLTPYRIFETTADFVFANGAILLVQNFSMLLLVAGCYFLAREAMQ